jgi:RNA polymerase sigma factor (sigma-70 family)
MKNLPAGFLTPNRRSVVVAVMLGTAALLTASSRAGAAEADLGAVTDISRYCTACWRNARLPADSWTDCTQDVFTRLLERVAPDAWHSVLRADGDERREFIRAIDAVKKRSQRSRKWVPLIEDGVADRTAGDERHRTDERQLVDRAASELLSERQQRILQMSFEGWSVQAIAEQLRTPAERISDDKYKAIRKLREHLCEAESA